MEWLAMPSFSSLDTIWGLSQLMFYLPGLCPAQELGGLSLHQKMPVLQEGECLQGSGRGGGWEGSGEDWDWTDFAADPRQNILCWGAVLRSVPFITTETRHTTSKSQAKHRETQRCFHIFI